MLLVVIYESKSCEVSELSQSRCTFGLHLFLGATEPKLSSLVHRLNMTEGNTT